MVGHTLNEIKRGLSEGCGLDAC